MITIKTLKEISKHPHLSNKELRKKFNCSHQDISKAFKKFGVDRTYERRQYKYHQIVKYPYLSNKELQEKFKCSKKTIAKAFKALNINRTKAKRSYYAVMVKYPHLSNKELKDKFKCSNEDIIRAFKEFKVKRTSMREFDYNDIILYKNASTKFICKKFKCSPRTVSRAFQQAGIKKVPVRRSKYSMKEIAKYSSLSNKQLEEKFGCCNTTITKAFKLNNINRRSNCGPEFKFNYKEITKRKESDPHLTHQEVADEFGCSISTVSRALRTCKAKKKTILLPLVKINVMYHLWNRLGWNLMKITRFFGYSTSSAVPSLFRRHKGYKPGNKPLWYIKECEKNKIHKGHPHELDTATINKIISMKVEDCSYKKIADKLQISMGSVFNYCKKYKNIIEERKLKLRRKKFVHKQRTQTKWEELYG